MSMTTKDLPAVGEQRRIPGGWKGGAAIAWRIETRGKTVAVHYSFHQGHTGVMSLERWLGLERMKGASEG